MDPMYVENGIYLYFADVLNYGPAQASAATDAVMKLIYEEEKNNA